MTAQVRAFTLVLLAFVLAAAPTASQVARSFLAQVVGGANSEKLHLRVIEEERASALISLADHVRRSTNGSCRAGSGNGVIGDSKPLLQLGADGRLRNATGEYVRLDREQICNESRPPTQCWLNFTVMYCGQLFELAVEIVDVNDWVPTFPRGEMQLEFSEAEEPPAWRKLPLAADLDAPAFSIRKYTLRKANSTDPFCLVVGRKLTSQRCDSFALWHPNSTDLYLVLSGKLDREARSEYRLELIAEDSLNKAHLNITVTISDVNDHTPRFNQPAYGVTFSEQPPDVHLLHDVMLLQVAASDADASGDADLTYSLEWSLPDDVSNYLEVNELGEIRARNNILDYERHSTFSFRVLAIDNRNGAHSVSRTGTAEVTVNLLDINDNAPAIKVDSLSAERISDTVVLFSVVENGAEQQFIARLTVSDADAGENGRVSCSVTPDATAGRNTFLITRAESANRNTEYQIRTAKVLDRELVPEYYIDVRCHDYGNLQQSTNQRLVIRVVDANDNAPRFSPTVYNFLLAEDTPATEQPIGVFNVTDGDEGANAEFQFWLDANVSSLFSVDSGRLVLTGQLDRELVENYTFAVYVRDLGEPALTASAVVKVRVTDVNDNAPQINRTLQIEVPENINSLPHLIYTVKVSDIDAPGTPNSNVSFMVPENGPFIVDNNGNLFLHAALNREIKRTYQFPLLVYDNGIPQLTSTCTVSVTVSDVNDEAPHFVYPPHNRTVVRVPSTLDLPIASFEARDEDAVGENSRIRYVLVSADDDIFTVNESSGQLFLRRFVGGSVTRQIKLAAIDGGKPALSSTIVHTIELLGQPLPPNANGDDDYGTFHESDANAGPRDRSEAIYIICAIVIGISACLAIFIIILILVRNRRYQQSRQAAVEEGKVKQPPRGRRPASNARKTNGAQSHGRPNNRSRPQSRNDTVPRQPVFSTAECRLPSDFAQTLKSVDQQCEEKACTMPMLPTSPLTVEYEIEHANRAAQMHGGFLQSNLLMNQQATLGHPPFLSPYKMTAFCMDCDACQQTLRDTNRTDRYQFSRPSSSAANVKRLGEQPAQLAYHPEKELETPRSTSAVLRRLETAASSSRTPTDHNSSESSESGTEWDDEKMPNPPADDAMLLHLPNGMLSSECNNNNTQAIVSGMLSNLNANRARSKASPTAGHQIAVHEVRPFAFDMQVPTCDSSFETMGVPMSGIVGGQPHRSNSGLSNTFKAPLKKMNFEHSFV